MFSSFAIATFACVVMGTAIGAVLVLRAAGRSGAGIARVLYEAEQAERPR
jgi:hypothetical protein